jgi:hypothetical protein
MTPPRRTAFVAADRLAGWVERFTLAHHGLSSQELADDGVRLAMRDGAVAVVAPPWPDDGRPGRGADPLERIVSVATQERRLGLLLVRRGGYGVGVSVAGELLAHKVGTASARSRGGDQGAAVVEKTVEEAARAFAGQSFEYLATGGDKQLIDAVLASPPLKRHAMAPRLAPLAVADPNMAVLRKAAADFCALRIQITDPDTND